MKKMRDPKDNKPIAIDIFSGCGGLTLGLKQAGFRVLGAVEIDPLAIATYRKNHPDVTIWDTDIRLVKGTEILKTLRIKKGELDLLAGCPPCQGFSTIRTHNGYKNIRDHRNNLIFDYIRLIKDLLPKAVMLENVPSLMYDKRMTRFKKELELLGYDLNNTPVILNAADYMVPQRRRRMIMICSRFRKIELPSKVKRRKTVREAIGGLSRPGKSGDVLHDLKADRSPRVLAIIKCIPKDGGSRKDLPRSLELQCHKNFPDGFNDVYGRMSWEDISPTITGGCINPSKGRFLHPSQNRSITLREAALLQTFPINYHFSLSRGKYAAAIMIGNALPPKFIKMHAIAVKKSLISYD
ncbi:MAG: DNA cytosine methyltransferase [Terracidiphilus sp.]|jgi:DNA (cytosine-5)-methyltransferase 1